MSDAPPPSEFRHRNLGGVLPSGWRAKFATALRAARRTLTVALVLCLPSAAGWAQRLVVGAHDGVVTAVAFSPNGLYLATGCEDGSIRVWSTATRQVAYSLPDSSDSTVRHGELGAIRDLCFSADSRMLYSADEKRKVLMWKVSRAAREMRDSGSADICCMAASPDGRLVTSGGADGRLGNFRANLSSGSYNEHHHDSPVTGVFWEPDSMHYVSVDAGGDWKRWGAVRDREFFRPAPAEGNLPPPKQVGEGPCAISPDRRVLAVIRRVDGAPRLRLCKFPSAETITEVVPQAPGVQDVRSIAFSPDGRTVALGGIDGKLHLWDVTPELVAAGLFHGPAPGPNPLVQRLAPNPWPALTTKLPPENINAPLENRPSRIYFEVPGEERFVVAVRKIEKGVVTAIGQDLRVPKLNGQATPLFLSAPSGDYALYWRKLLEPGVVHQHPQRVTVHYDEKREGSKTTYTWRNVVVTLDEKGSKVDLRPESMPNTLKR